MNDDDEMIVEPVSVLRECAEYAKKINASCVILLEWNIYNFFNCLDPQLALQMSCCLCVVLCVNNGNKSAT